MSELTELIKRGNYTNIGERLFHGDKSLIADLDDLVSSDVCYQLAITSMSYRITPLLVDAVEGATDIGHGDFIYVEKIRGALSLMDEL